MNCEPTTAYCVRIDRQRDPAGVEYDVIRVHIADMYFQRNLICDRDIRLAKRLADSHGAQFWVAHELQARVDAVLAEGR